MDPASPNDSSLQQELSRVSQKLSETQDADIRRALESRIAELETQIQAVKPPEPVLPTQSEPEMRAELAKTSQRLYSEADPGVRATLQARVAELQKFLNIDVGRIAQGELIPEVQPTSKKAKKTPEKDRSRTTMADLEALVATQKAKIHAQAKEEALTSFSTFTDLPDTNEPDSPESVEAAEKLIQQARVELLRNNKAKVRELIQQAARTAPNSPGVLEMVGDDYAEARQYAKAMGAYQRAIKIDPKNVQVERKLAQIALALDSARSPIIDESATPMASQKAAFFITLFLPGLGHIVVGQKTKGGIILGIWCIAMVAVILMGGDLAKVGAQITGGHQQPNYLVLAPFVVMVITFIYALGDFKKPKEMARQNIDRPRPPVDLPFD